MFRHLNGVSAVMEILFSKIIHVIKRELLDALKILNKQETLDGNKNWY